LLGQQQFKTKPKPTQNQTKQKHRFRRNDAFLWVWQKEKWNMKSTGAIHTGNPGIPDYL